MPDFSARGSFGRMPYSISNYGDTGLGDYMRGSTTSAGTATLWTTANTAVYCPFVLTWPYLAQKIGFQVTTQSGNCDVGIYDEKGTRLISAGSTAVAAAGLQVVNITDTWLLPGTYFMAINVDNTTAAFLAVSTIAAASRTAGIQQQAVGAVTLPNPATFATYTARSTPLMIISGATI
jgi:hypothetical protein